VSFSSSRISLTPHLPALLFPLPDGDSLIRCSQFLNRFGAVLVLTLVAVLVVPVFVVGLVLPFQKNRAGLLDGIS
jgi:hypothetical protein